MIVEIKKTDGSLGIRKGQWYAGEPYQIDPSKITLLYRISKKTLARIGKKVVICNQYKSDINILYRDGIITNNTKY